MSEKLADGGKSPTLENATDLQAEVAELRAKLARLEAQQSHFVPMRPTQQRPIRSYTPPEDLQVQAVRGLHRGEAANGSVRWYDTPQGRNSLPAEYRPIFQPGDIVRINPDAPIWGTVTPENPEGVKWSTQLEAQHLDGVGEVLACMGITRTFEPKYKVSIRGMGRADGNGTGFRESELLFAQ